MPDGVLYLTCGIDTQDNRFEAEVVGWGVGKESWGIRYQRIYGDLKRGQVWADLDAFLSTTWKKRDGTELSIRAACMDSGGHFPDQVIRFCKEREDRHIWAIKGRGGMDVPYIRNPTKNNRVGGELFVLGVDTGKNAVLARLKVLIKGPNYCHFPAGQDAGYDESYFKMLTAEHKVTHWKGGRKVERWELKDPAQKRNEAFDVRNYATAALEISNPPAWKSRARVRRVRQNRSTSTAEEDREEFNRCRSYQKKSPSSIWRCGSRPRKQFPPARAIRSSRCSYPRQPETNPGKHFLLGGQGGRSRAGGTGAGQEPYLPFRPA